MNKEERMRKVVDFLQRRITADFEYPFKVAYEDGCLEFRLRNDEKEYRARLKQTEEVVSAILQGTEDEIEQATKRIYEVLQAAVTVQEMGAADPDAGYENGKKRLVLRPLNYQYVEKELTDVPHFKIGDIALVLYSVMAHRGSDYFTAKVQRNQIEKWGKKEEDILHEALGNTALLYQPRLYSLEDLLSWDECGKECGVFMEAGAKRELEKNVRGYVLTNTLEINGAVSVFYPEVAERISEMMKDDLYLAFTSIHEVQVHAAGTIGPDVIRNSLRDTNKHCNRNEEVLTNNVYCFSREKKCFGLMEDNEFKPLEWEMGKVC